MSDGSPGADTTNAPPPSTHADSETLREALKERGLGAVELSTFDTLSSTNDYLLGSLPTGTAVRPDEWRLCVAWQQTEGRGRRGKVWRSSASAITGSLAVSTRRPPAELSGLSLVTGVALAEVLEPVIDHPVMVKWPNDLMVDDLKLAGILTELINGPVPWVVSGIGLNWMDAAPLRALGIGAVGLSSFCATLPDKPVLLADMVEQVMHRQRQFLAGQWQFSDAAWVERDWLSGKVIAVEGDEAGTACGVDDRGALQIDACGRRHTVLAGEVSVRTVS